jgi:hypothetical protein
MKNTTPKHRPVNSDSIPTRFFPWIDYNDGKSATSAAGNTLPELIADVYRTASYYASIRPGDRIVLKLSRMCVRCEGAGRIATRRRFGFKPCSACKGADTLQEFDPIELKMSESVKITNDCL